MKVNRGKKCVKYCISLVYRGHVNDKYIDVVVRLQNRVVERLGHARWHKDDYMYTFKMDRLNFWISNCTNVVLSKGFKKLLLKLVNVFN